MQRQLPLTSDTNTLPVIKSGFRFLMAFPKTELYRLVVDGCQQKEGKGFVKYENTEKHSIVSFLKGLLEGKEFIDQQSTLSVPFFKKTHKNCRDGITSLTEVPSGEFITHSTHGFPIYQVSVGGLNDLCKFALKYPEIAPSFMFDGKIQSLTPYNVNNMLNKWRMKNSVNKDKKENYSFSYVVNITEEICEKISQKIIDDCNLALSAAKKDDDIVKAIVDCIYDLEHLHPFKDVNLRTVMATADILLMKYGFPPVTYLDPNYLDGCSKDEFFEIIKQGMLQTLEIIQDPNKAYFDFKSSDLTPQQKEEYQALISPMETALSLGYAITPEDSEATTTRIKSLKTTAAPEWILDKKQFDDKASQKFYPLNGFHSTHSPKISNHSERFFDDSILTTTSPAVQRSAQQCSPKKAILDEFQEETITVFRETIVDWASKSLDASKLFENINSLGDPHAEIIKGITLITISVDSGVPDEVVNKLKGIKSISNPDLTPNK